MSPPSALTVIVLSTLFAAALFGVAVRLFRRKSSRDGTQADDDLGGVSDDVQEAELAFMQLREDYRHYTATVLVDLEQKVELLKVNSRQASGQRKAALDATLSAIHLKRVAFDGDHRAIELVPTTMWSETTTRLRNDLSDMIALVDRA